MALIYYVWNPVTSQLICLPELPLPEEELKDEDDEVMLPSPCVFTSSPDEDNCVLVLFFDGGLTFSCRPTTSRNCSWAKHHLELCGSSVSIQRAVVLDGVIYAQARLTQADDDDDDDDQDDQDDQDDDDDDDDEDDQDDDDQDDDDKGRRCYFVRMNVAHDCSDSNYSIILEPMTLELPGSEINFPTHGIGAHVVECCGEFYYITIRIWIDGVSKYMSIINVYVWKLDFSQMKWIKIESLKNRAFLLNNRSCTWCWAPAPSIEENFIYILGNSRIYSYNLQDDSYTIGSYPSLSSDRLILLLSSFWNFLHATRYINEDFQDDMRKSVARSLLPKLPTDMVQLISRRMNMFDCMNLGATCKTMYDANLIAEWRAYCSCPLFMVRKDNKGTYELLDPFENISHPISTFDDSPTNLSIFECCQDGWLVLRSNRDYLRFLNPFTRKKIDDCLFVFCPVQVLDFQQVLLLLISWLSEFLASKREWLCDEMEFNPDKDIPFYPNGISSPRYHKNALYFIVTNGCLGVLKINQGKLTWHVYKKLASVFIGDMGSWVRVFKFDTLDKCWLELDTLGDYVIRASCFSVKSKKSEMKNRIYLPRYMDNEIVFYSLDTKMYHTASNTKSMYNFYGMKAQSSCCWVY
ncbi:hypothetical protein RND81_09G040400 [Saponaria officinalis]|uniref:KIB1-4 beta-propeller domain-containing protein n=1 Tax=Saponaria officinalis TaxID=3572 RepID=A0AAW1IGG1_SAPOF